MSKINNRLKIARIQAGCKTATAAIELYGWEASIYRKHENGCSVIDEVAMHRYASAYGVSLSWLISGENKPLLAKKDEMLDGTSESLKEDGI